jgi:hypothetical protein
MEKEWSLKEDDCKNRELFVKILEKLECPYTIEKDQKEYNIRFEYNRETFYADVYDGMYDVNIWDPYWFGVEIEQEAFERLRVVINEFNAHNEHDPMLFYTIMESENKVWIHSRLSFPIVPNTPDIEGFVKERIQRFLPNQIDFFHELNRRRNHDWKKSILEIIDRNDKDEEITNLIMNKAEEIN